MGGDDLCACFYSFLRCCAVAGRALKRVAEVRLCDRAVCQKVLEWVSDIMFPCGAPLKYMPR